MDGSESNKESVLVSHNVDRHVKESNVTDRKGKQVIYELDDNSDDCEILDDLHIPLGPQHHPGESSKSSNIVITSSLATVHEESGPTSHDGTRNEFLDNGIQTDNDMRAPECVNVVAVMNYGNVTESANTQNKFRSINLGKKDSFEIKSANHNHHIQKKGHQCNIPKYTERLKTIVLEHNNLAVEMFILKKKVEELMTVANNMINEVITAGIIITSKDICKENMPPHITFPTNQSPKHVDKWGSKQKVSVVSDVRSPMNPRKELPILQNSNKTHNYNDLPLHPACSPFTVSKKGALSHSSSVCGSNSKLVRSSCNKESPHASNVKMADNSSSVNGIIVGYSPQAPLPYDKGSNASNRHDRPFTESIYPMELNSYDFEGPSFNLVSEFELNNGDIVLDDGIVLTSEFIAEMDELAKERLSRSDKKQANERVPGHIAKCKSGAELHMPCSARATILISPIPINFEDLNNQLNGDLMIQRSASKVTSMENASSSYFANIFVYKTCMDSPSTMDIIKFNRFYRDCIKNSIKTNVTNRDARELTPKIKLGPITIDTKIWWHDLREVAMPLNDSHIDTAFYFMRMLLKLRTGHKIRATSTDCNFDVKIRGISNEIVADTKAIHKHESLFLYANGRKIPFNILWDQVDHVLIPMWLGNPGHWILGHFDIAQWRFDVYNSCIKSVKNVTVYAAVCSMVLTIPILLRSVKSKSRIFPDISLECRLIDHCPQQMNGGIVEYLS